ncbi:MAG: MBL fold metallo-hydrolase [Deltaproteobacteria bacterium]|nr:MBL fold metallo-hydrolase [Deltaproteobacteria bacterium]
MTIELEILGAARGVTGSRHLVRTSKATVLLDCGLFQGHRAEANARNRHLGFDPSTIDAVVLSHAHLDHSGALPILCHQGYHGPIHTTPATLDLCGPLLEDAAALQQADARHIASLIARGVDLQPVVALYDHDDVAATLARLEGVRYHRPHVIAPGVELTLLDAGHVLGSAIVVLDLDDDGEHVRLAFTGDLGRRQALHTLDPDLPERVHVLVSESTYGDRLHRPIAESRDELARAVARTVRRGGKVIIPSFALERAQEVVYTLKQLRAEDRVGPPVPVYLDSPLATRLTNVFRRYPGSYGQAALDLLHVGDSPFDFEGLRYVTDAEDSKAVGETPGPAVIIAGSGMCEGGRVLHHLRTTISDPKNTIIMVGFQAEHTLGRRIAERRKEVRIFGLMHDLHAEVVVLDGFSAHADQQGLLDFAEAVRARGPLRQVVLVHGEPAAEDALAAELGKRGFPQVAAPERGARIRI